MESVVVWVGLLSGVALIVATVVVYVKKSAISSSGLALPVIGAILIGMTVWSDVTVSAGSANIRFVRDLSAATQDLAAEVVKVASDVDRVRNELASSVGELQSVVSRLTPSTAPPEVVAGLARVEQYTLAAQSIEVNFDAIAAINGTLQEIAERELPTAGWRGFPLRVPARD